MTELQVRMLQLLREIDEICKLHHIQYFLFAGTALGAQRHSGFIPWDDDTDIIMTLPNYEKFLSVVGGHLRQDRSLDWLENDPDYLLTYARYVDTSTTALQRHTVFGGMKPGVKVDIFCVVPTFSDESLRQQHVMDVLGFAEVLCSTGKMMEYRPEGFYEVYRREQQKLDAAGRQTYIKDHLHELMHRADGQTEKVLLFSGMMSNTKTYDASIFQRAVYVPFETITLPVSIRNGLFIAQHIAESWPDLPRHVEKPRHALFVDLEHPYQEYLFRMKEQMDLERAGQAAHQRKVNNLYERDIFRDIFIRGQQLRNLAVEMDITEGFRQLQDPYALSVPQLEDFFESYYEIQQTGSNKTLGQSVQLDKDIFRLAIDTLIRAGRYYEAASIIRTCIAAGVELADSSWLAGAHRRIEWSRELSHRMYIDQDIFKTAQLLRDYKELNDTMPYAAAQNWVSLVTGSTEENCRRAYYALSDAIHQFGPKGELLLLHGECMEKMGRDQQAKETYAKAASCVRNGYAYQRLLEKGTPWEKVYDKPQAEHSAPVPGALSTSIYEIMTGKSSSQITLSGRYVLQKAYLAEAKRRGLISRKDKKRYKEYRKWVKQEKKGAENRYEAYSQQFFGIERIR